MTYDQARAQIKTGDVALVKGGTFIRVATGESYGHVAVFVWLADGLWVFEFSALHGYQAMPASQWFADRAGQLIYWGVAPVTVSSDQGAVTAAAISYRGAKPVRRWYGWLSLPVVWLSQVSGRRLPVWLKVCSTFAQELWEAAGYRQFARTADPGDFAEHCRVLHRIGG